MNTTIYIQQNSESKFGSKRGQTLNKIVSFIRKKEQNTYFPIIFANFLDPLDFDSKKPYFFFVFDAAAFGDDLL